MRAERGRSSSSICEQAISLLWVVISTAFTSAFYSFTLCFHPDAIAAAPPASSSSSSSSGIIRTRKSKINIRREGKEEEESHDNDVDDNADVQLPPIAFYKGTVWHERKAPSHHKFSYSVRYALINLDSQSASLCFAPNHLSASQARAIAGSDGPVYLLTVPSSVGYEQNPLSVYYCFNDDETSLSCCIAEVTNTPWGERVTFLFNPDGDVVAKPLHVSPFMDMLGAWKMKTRVPGRTIAITITVQHPEFGNFFTASLNATRIEGLQTSVEKFFWFMPHKTALGIYWQAFLLWWKGVRFLQHPKYIDGNEYRFRAIQRDQDNLKEGKTGLNICPASLKAPCCRSFTWYEAQWPWT